MRGRELREREHSRMTPRFLLWRLSSREKDDDSRFRHVFKVPIGLGYMNLEIRREIYARF